MSGRPPAAVALGDQIHAEITERALRNFAAMLHGENLTPSEDEQTFAEIGIQAGLHAAMQTLSDHGWIK